MIVYVAGPYTTPDVAINMKNAMDAAAQLIEIGYTVVVPHLSHFLHMNNPQPYETWMRMDLEILEKCDAVLRIFGESPGADRETARAYELGIPVYRSIEELINTEPI